VAIAFFSKPDSLNIFPPIKVEKKTEILLTDKTSATGAILTASICVHL